MTVLQLKLLLTLNSFKLLGVVFGSSLSFSSHVDALCKKISRLTGFVIRIFPVLSPYALQCPLASDVVLQTDIFF